MSSSPNGAKRIEEYLHQFAMEHIIPNLKDLGVLFVSDLKFVDYGDIDQMPLTAVQRRRLKAEILKMITPHSKQVSQREKDEKDEKDSTDTGTVKASRRSLFSNIADSGTDSRDNNKGSGIEFYTHKSPMERDIEEKEYEKEMCAVQLLSVRDSLQELESEYPVCKKTGKQCGKCHLRGKDHNKRQCPAHAECPSAKKCGDMTKHPDEKKELDDLLKLETKFQRELKSLEMAILLKRKALDSPEIKFENQMRSPLINSNKAKYLFQSSGGVFTEKTLLIDTDLAILAKYYNRTVPSNITGEEKMFKLIIGQFKVPPIPKSNQSVYQRPGPLNDMRQTLQNRGINFPFPGDNFGSAAWGKPLFNQSILSSESTIPTPGWFSPVASNSSEPCYTDPHHSMKEQWPNPPAYQFVSAPMPNYQLPPMYTEPAPQAYYPMKALSSKSVAETISSSSTMTSASSVNISEPPVSETSATGPLVEPNYAALPFLVQSTGKDYEESSLTIDAVQNNFVQSSYECLPPVRQNGLPNFRKILPKPCLPVKKRKYDYANDSY